MFQKIIPKTWMLGITLFAATHGCEKSDSQIAREAADRQAQQNTEMARLNKEVASGTHQLVEADAKARQEIVGVHRDLQTERTRLDTSWKDIEDERRQIAGQRRTESMMVSVCKLFGGISLVVVLLSFCWYALVASRRGDGTEEQLNELLIQEVLPDEQTLLAADEQPTALLGLSRPQIRNDR